MSKLLFLLIAFGHAAAFAEPISVDPEIALEDLFSEEDLASLKDEDEDSILFDEITQAEADAEDLFQ